MLVANSSLLFGDVQDAVEGIKESKLYDVFRKMPKGAHLHFHIDAGLSVEEFIEYTKEDFVYYSFETNLLKVAPNGLNYPGYVKCNELRVNWNQTGTFDDYLKSKLMLTKEQTKSRNTQIIWGHFIQKFDIIAGLVNYHKFYKSMLLKVARNALKDGVRIVEIRYHLGVILNDNCGNVYNATTDHKSGVACITAPGETLNIKENLDLYQEVLDQIHQEDPNFEFSIIAMGLRSQDHEFAIQQINYYKFAIDNGYKFVTGYDLVNYEDKHKPIHYCVQKR